MDIFFACTFYFVAAVITLGVAHKIKRYWTTAAPFRIPLTPAPATSAGVLYRIAGEVLLFKSLFKANKWIWLFGWVFHASLLLIMMRHLVYFQQQPALWIYQLQPYSRFASYAMLCSLLGLLLRRLLIDRMRYISSPSDFLMLVLLLAIGSSGLSMLLFWPPDVIAVQRYFSGLLRFTIHPLPQHFLLFVHLFLVAVLIFIFPFSKLLHAPGVFFSPTLNQADNARQKRHQ